MQNVQRKLGFALEFVLHVVQEEWSSSVVGNRYSKLVQSTFTSDYSRRSLYLNFLSWSQSLCN